MRWLWIGLDRVELDQDDLLVTAQRKRKHVLLDLDGLLVYDVGSGKVAIYIRENLVLGDITGYPTTDSDSE